MSTRTHAPECAKTVKLRWYEENRTKFDSETDKFGLTQRPCTCGAEYQPSIEERLRHAEHDRETLEKLENMFEAVGADLVEAVESMRDAQREMIEVSRG